MAAKKKAKPTIQFTEPIGPEPEPQPDARLRESICFWVREGVIPRRAAIAEGVAETHFDEWMRADTRECVLLREQLDRAEAIAETTVVGRIKHAAKTDWKAAAWLAERNWPERYQRRSIQGDDAPRRQEPSQADPFSELDNVVDIRSTGGTS